MAAMSLERQWAWSALPFVDGCLAAVSPLSSSSSSNRSGSGGGGGGGAWDAETT